MATTLQDFVGTFSLDHENSGDLGSAQLALAGVNTNIRTMLTKLNVDITFTIEGDILTKHLYTTFVEKTLRFQLGGKPTVYYDEAFSVDFIRLVKYENGKLSSEMKEKTGRFTINECRYLSDDKKILYYDAHMTCGSQAAESKRQFVRKLVAT